MKLNLPGAARRPDRTAALARDLAALACPDARDEAFGHQLARRLTDAECQTAPAPERSPILNSPVLPAPGRPGLSRRWRPLRLAAAGAALLLLVLAAFVYVSFNNTPPASAQAVLAQAAAPHLDPNQGAHYRYSLSDPRDPQMATGSADVWVVADAQGRITRTGLTLTSHDPTGAVSLIQHQFIIGSTTQQYDYNPRTNTATVRIGPADQVMSDQPNYFDGASVAQYLARAGQGGVRDAQLLPPQRLDGVPVLAIRSAGDADGPLTAYFDARTYLLRGFDSGAARIRLTSEVHLPATDVPAAAFTWTPPAGAQVTTVDLAGPDSGGDSTSPEARLPALCHLPAGALDAGRAAHRTPLAVCQVADPNMTQTALVADLLYPFRRQDDTDVAAGKITAAQEAQNLAQLQQKFTLWLTQPLDAGR